MSFPNLSDLAASTIEARQKVIADNVTAHNAVLNWINKSGNIVEFNGGTVINEAFSFAENGNGGSYSGYDYLPVAAQDVISGAQFQVAQYAVPVTFSGREQLINAGKAQIIDLIEARVTVAENTMNNLLNRHIYLDGTGNNGKNITGLAAAMPLAPTNTYGGIDRSATANSFWKNKKYQASVDGAGVATSATILSQWNTFITSVTRGSDRPDVIICGPAVFAVFEAALQAMQHIYSAEDASAGFRTLSYQGIPVVFDTTAGGIATTDAYFVNSKYLKWRPHASRNMVALDDKQAVNQDATVKTLAWAGNLTSSGTQFLGKYSNT
jgi:hypothetical protein